MKPKSTAEKMAEFIMRSPIDFCKQCCAEHRACNEKMNELYNEHKDDNDYIAPLPPESQCIANIIKFFEQAQ
ncbi:MAG: hypothetical protein ACI4MS_00510 [Candidatus Coproplasma sp.]